MSGEQVQGAPIYGQPVPGAPANKNKTGILIAVIAVIAVAVIAVGAVLLFKKSPTPNPNPSNPNATGLPPHTTLVSFQNQLENQLKAPQPGGYAVTGVSSVVCNMPHVWAAGNTFTCYVYDKNSNELGTVAGTVETTQPNEDWNARTDWKPDSSNNTNNTNSNAGNTNNTNNTNTG